MSINKAVAYLILGSIVSVVIGIVFMRVRPGRGPNRRQALGETIYEIAQVQVAEQGLPTKAIGRWFPYVATLMIFIWVVNILGFIPLPLSDERWQVGGIEIPTLAIFAATSTLSVTLALALMTFVFTHVEGIRANGVWPYFKSWIPDVPKVMLPLIIPLEILGQFMRLISLSVRLYANMLAGHMLILTFIGLIFVLENVFLAVVAFRQRRSSISSRSSSSSRSRRTSSPPCPPSTSARPSSPSTKEESPQCFPRSSSSPPPKTAPTPARRSRSRSASVSAPSEPASASATSSAR